jgi:hypothetical protein
MGAGEHACAGAHGWGLGVVVTAEERDLGFVKGDLVMSGMGLRRESWSKSVTSSVVDGRV